MRNYKGPLFQHRHYAEIANAIAETRGLTREDLVRKLTYLFQGDNGNFNRARFEAACAGTPSNGRDKR